MDTALEPLRNAICAISLWSMRQLICFFFGRRSSRPTALRVRWKRFLKLQKNRCTFCRKGTKKSYPFCRISHRWSVVFVIWTLKLSNISLVLWFSRNTSSGLFFRLYITKMSHSAFMITGLKRQHYFLITSFCHFPNLTRTWVHFQAKEEEKRNFMFKIRFIATLSRIQKNMYDAYCL